MNEKRILRLMVDAINRFNLNLTDLVVLTEAASGYFALTPLIAALSGAKEVVAIGRDSDFGTFQEVSANILSLALKWNCADIIRLVSSKQTEDIARADLVTNLGFVRPIDSQMIQFMKPTACVSLMWEPWELRAEDIDMDACRMRGIPILGTDERSTQLRTFEYVGILALKLLLEAEIETLLSKVVVLGGGYFGAATIRLLKQAGATLGWVRPSSDVAVDEVAQEDVPVWQSLSNPQAQSFLCDSDAMVVVEHHRREQLIGPIGMLDFGQLNEINSALVVIHICGEIDKKSLENSGLEFYPKTIRQSGSMSLTTAYLGPRPLIDLHTAGLRVGEVLARSRLAGASNDEAKKKALRSTPARALQ